MDWKKLALPMLVGRTVLYQGYASCIKAIVGEVSPNGEYVYLDGSWRKVDEVIILDVFPVKAA